jgi:hypothetical protein
MKAGGEEESHWRAHIYRSCIGIENEVPSRAEPDRIIPFSEGTRRP